MHKNGMIKHPLKYKASEKNHDKKNQHKNKTSSIKDLHCLLWIHAVMEV